MKNLMQLVKMVLDVAYFELPAQDEADKDRLVKTEFERLTPAYRNLTDASRPAINYSEPVTRFAYIYKYTVAHADYASHGAD